MTIYKVIPQDKKEEKKLAEKDVLTVPLTDAENVEPVQVNVRQQRSKTWLNLFLILIALLVLATGATAGYYLYKNHMSPNKLKHAKGRCSFIMRKTEDDPTSQMLQDTNSLQRIDDGGLTGPDQNPSRKHHHRKHRKHHGPFSTVKMEEEIEVTDNIFERISMPQIDDILKSLILHDFERNKSAIVDYHDRVCYVMNLNRNEVSPPKNLIDLLNKINSGYYLPRAHVLRRKYRVMSPPLQNIAYLGPYIVNECSNYKTFQLMRLAGDDEMMGKWIVKRSAGEVLQEKVYGYYDDMNQALFKYNIYQPTVESF
ncbi:integral membrane protein 2B-like [Mizuhopecten yessoensis]|uniref:Integral membrane protein 2 n=1 Tax=Mizuhopecten yessoensis TaxID=6573 RepID=A0A210PRR0_MIZYE|nr:integral membrane protein 2B-like [Mizuhopecten yessoensis]OWF39197.1 Integral membrane protein 2B [Mizuhopecten yessoensis]